jgi:hypothetical protein
VIVDGEHDVGVALPPIVPAHSVLIVAMFQDGAHQR